MPHYLDELEIEEEIPVSTATPEEQAAHEKEENDPEYIINIRGRIANLVGAKTNSHLTPVGDQLCNMYAHVMKDFYVLAAHLPGDWGEELRILIRKNEEMPANLIALQPRR